MFREMRRKDKALSEAETKDFLEKISFGTLAINSVEGFPYSVPISYAYAHGKIYFHSANSGLKYESLNADDKVSFSVVGKDDVQPSEFTTLYRSVIVYGHCKELNSPEEINKALEAIVSKYSKGFEKEGKDYAHKYAGKFAVYAIEIEHMTGKGKG